MVLAHLLTPQYLLCIYQHTTFHFINYICLLCNLLKCM